MTADRPERSSTDQRLRRALRPTTVATPSTDLFERVLDAVEGDRSRRRTARRTLGTGVLALVVLVALVLLLTPRENGRLLMPWWILEVATTALLLGLALWLGPFIKRFGRAYAADVFHDNPQTGKSYIVLTDIVYYLIFAAYVLATVHVDQSAWTGYAGTVTPRMVAVELTRVAGILLIIGALHGINIVLMPVLGQLFSVNRRISGRAGARSATHEE